MQARLLKICEDSESDASNGRAAQMRTMSGICSLQFWKFGEFAVCRGSVELNRDARQ